MNKNYSNEIINSSTGNFLDLDTKIIKENIGKYIVTILITSENKFVRILEIQQDKKYLDIEKKMAINKYLDVNEFYEE